MSTINSHIDSITKWLIKGWVFAGFNSDPVDVSLYVNDQLVIEKTRAGLERKGLRVNKKHATGYCGFKFYLGDKIALKNGDQVELKVFNNGTEESFIKRTFDYELADPKVISPDNARLLIVGLGKSGTTALTYKLASALNDPVINFEPQRHKGLLKIELHKRLTKKAPVVTKSLFGHNLEINFGKIAQIYDRKIWIIRDPRDQLISMMLYRWFKGHKPNPERFREALKLVKQKEQNPQSVPILDIWSKAANLNHLRESQTKCYKYIHNIFENIKDEWLIFKYTDLIDENFDELDKYISVKTSESKIEIPDKFKRVARSKSYGNWRNWFTPKDVNFFKPIFEEILQYCSFDTDWELNDKPELNPEKGSLYMEKLFHGDKKS